MKKSRSVTLTLAALASSLVAACGRDTGTEMANAKPTQTVRCYQDPAQPDVCVQIQRQGYVPMYYPLFYNGFYYGPTGYIAPSPAVGTADYNSARARSQGTTFSPRGNPVRAPVIRGGIGATGTGRSAVS